MSRALFSSLALLCACTPPVARQPETPPSAPSPHALSHGEASVPASSADLASALRGAHSAYLGLVEAVETWRDACGHHVWLELRVELGVLASEPEGETVNALLTMANGGSGCAAAGPLHVGTEVPATFHVGQRQLFVHGPARREAKPPDEGSRVALETRAILDIDALPAALAALPQPQHALSGLSAAPPFYRIEVDVAVEERSGVMWQRQSSPAPLRMQAAAQYCAGLSLAGHDDWRLPGLYELITVIDFARREPALDPQVFPSPASGLLWSGTEWAGEPWVLDLDDGALHWTHYDDPSSSGAYFARCVRGHEGRSRAATVGSSSIQMTGAALEDPQAGLAWLPALAPSALSHAEAEAYCAEWMHDGHDDWRLPAIKELLLLNQHACPGELPVTWSAGSPWDVAEGEEDGVWSATAAGEGSAWRINTPCGPHFWPEAKSERFRVLCVRDIPIVAPAALEHACPATHQPNSDGHARWCEKDGVRDGPYASRYPGGMPFAHGAYRNGKRHGSWRYRRDHGAVVLSLELAAGKLHGSATRYFGNGAPAEQGRYAEGIADGVWTRWHQNGAQERLRPFAKGRVDGVERTFYPNGAPQTVERYERGVLAGEAVHHDDDGGRSVFRYRDGRRDGLQRSYHPNGKLAQEDNYRADERHGLQRTWHDNGQLAYEASYVDGTLEGSERAFYADGQRRIEGELRGGKGVVRHYHDNGKLERAVTYAGGQPDGEVVTHDDAGRKRGEEHFLAGKLHGVQRSWHDNGQLDGEVVYRDGEREGLARRWHDNGKLAVEETYAGGERVGPYREYDRDGALYIEGEYNRAGERHGVWRAYREGRVVEMLEYQDGAIVRPPQ